MAPSSVGLLKSSVSKFLILFTIMGSALVWVPCAPLLYKVCTQMLMNPYYLPSNLCYLIYLFLKSLSWKSCLPLCFSSSACCPVCICAKEPKPSTLSSKPHLQAARVDIEPLPVLPAPPWILSVVGCCLYSFLKS